MIARFYKTRKSPITDVHPDRIDSSIARSLRLDSKARKHCEMLDKMTQVTFELQQKHCTSAKYRNASDILIFSSN